MTHCAFCAYCVRMTTNAPAVTWTCSHCTLSLHLAGTLWRTDDGDAFCKAAGPDVITEQYAAEGVTPSGGVGWTSKMHAPRSSWVHPALRESEA